MERLSNREIEKLIAKDMATGQSDNDTWERIAKRAIKPIEEKKE